MEETIVKAGQSWWDVGIELSGAWVAGIDLALKAGCSMTAPAPAGLKVRSSKTYDKPMELYCHAEGVSPATHEPSGASEAMPRYQIFSSTFNIVYS